MEFPKPAERVLRNKGRMVKFRDEIERREKYLKKINFSERMYTDLIVAQCMAERPEKRGSFLDLQLIIEAFQKKMKERPDHELLEEQQATISDMRRKMEENAKTLAELEPLREQLHDMSKYNEELQEKLQNREKDSARMATERVRLHELENQLSKQEEVIKDANRDMLNLKQKLRRTEEVCERLKSYEDQCRKSEAQLKEQEKKLRAAEEEKTSLSARLMKAEESLEDTKVQLEMCMKEKKAVVEDLTANNKRFDNHLKKVKGGLERDLADSQRAEKTAKKEVDMLKAQLRNKEHGVNSFGKQLTEAKTRADTTERQWRQLEGQLRTANTGIANLEKSKMSIKSELESIKVERNAHLQEKERLSTKNVELEKDIRLANKKLRAAKEEKISLSTRLTKAEESLEDTKSKLEQCNKENEELSWSLDGLQKAKTVVEEELHKVETERDSALKSARQLETKLSTKTDAVKVSEEKWRKSHHLFSKEKKTFWDQCSRMEEQLKEEEQMKEQAIQDLKEMKSKADTLAREKEALEKSTLMLEDELNQKRVEVKCSRSNTKELEEQLKDTAKQRDELKQKSEELARHSEDAKKSLQAKEEKCKMLEESLEQTQKQLQEMQSLSSQTDDDKSRQIQDLEKDKKYLSKKLQGVNDTVENQKDLVSKLENEKENLQKEINRLNQSNAKLKSDYEKELQLADHRANEEMQKLKRKHSNLKDKVREKANTLQQKQREIEDLSTKVHESQELLEKENEVKQQMEADCRRLENNLKSEKKRHKEITEEYRNKTALLEDEKGRLLTEKANLEEAGDRLVQEKEELEEQLVNMEAAIKALTVNRDELADEKESLLGTVVDLEKERDNLRSSMADLESVKSELLQERMCLEEKFTEAVRRCDDLQEACSDLGEKYSNLEQQHVHSLQINEDEMNLLKEELNETRCKLQEKQTEHDSSLKLSKKLQFALDESNECAEELKVRNSDLVGELEQLRTSECALSAVVNEKDEELTKLTLAVEDYKGKFEGARVQHGKLIEKFEALAIEKEAWQRKCEEFAGVDERLKLVVSEKDDLEKKSEELMGSLAEYSERIRLLDKEVTERTSEIDNLEGERDSLKQALRKSEEKLSECSADLDSTSVQLVHFKGECERIQVECDRVQNENVRMQERLLRNEKVHKQQIDLSENVAASKQSAIVTLWAESYVDEVVEQVLEGQLQKVTTKLEDVQSKLNGREDELRAVTARLAEEEQKCQQLQYQESCLSEELANIEEDLRREKEKCARYRDEVSGLENAQMDVVVQKDAIERDLVVLRDKNEQNQKELSHHKRRLAVVERDFRQAKDAENQLRAQCEDFKTHNKILVEENAVYRKALEAKTASSFQLQEENLQLKALKKQEKQIKAQKQTLRQGRKALQQDMVDLEKKRASLEGKQELLQECSMLTQQSLEDDRKLQIEEFKDFRQEQLIAVDRMCNKLDKSLRQQRKEQQQLFEGIVQDMEVHHSRQREEQELAVKKLEQNGESVLRRLKHDLMHNAKEKEELIGSEVQKVSKPPILAVQANSEIFKLLQKFEIVCRLLNCYVPDIVNPTNDGLCESLEEMTSTCDPDSFTVFDVCNVQHLQDQFKLPVAVRNFVESLRLLIRGPSIVCSLPFIVFAGDVCFCHLLLATSPFLIAADPEDALRMEPTLVCALAKATLTGDIEQEIITCQRKWENISKGVIFHPTWGEQEPKNPIALKYPSVKLPVQLEPVLEQLNLGMARKLHGCKPELVRSLIPYYLEECKK